MRYTVKQLATEASVSVRTLHYYDAIGLLKPSHVLPNGYRQYGDAEVMKLRQILFFRELEFPLETIMHMIHSPSYDVRQALHDQKQLLLLKKKRIHALIRNIDSTEAHVKGGDHMKQKKLFSGFPEDHINAYKKEVEERWGNTDAYRQSRERTKNWTKDDYARVQTQATMITRELADAMDKGSNSPEFQSAVSEHYKSIQQFYDCSPEMYRSLGQMYVEDVRFRDFYDSVKKGLATCLRDGITYFCDTRERG